MAYSLRRGEPIDEAVPAIVRDQTNAAVAVLLTADHSERNAVALDARKRCKKVRGLLRLVRGSLGHQYRPADQAYRAVAHALAARREVEANVATLDRLVAASPAELLPADRFCPVRAGLVRRTGRVAENGAGDPTATAARLLGELLDEVGHWSFSTGGWAALESGFERTYRQGVTRLDDVLADPTPEGFHDLRKRVKYTWYHLRLLRRSAPSMLVPLAEQFHRLAIGLGDAHDLVELAEVLLTDPEAFGGEDVVDRAVLLIDERRSMVEDGCLGLAVRLYAESPGELTERLGRYWRSWQRYGDEQPLRSIRPPRAARSSTRSAP